MSQITITFGDGKQRRFQQGTTIADAIKAYDPKLSHQAVAALVNEEKKDLSFALKEDCTVVPMTCSDPEGLQVFWHSASHIMAQAIKDLFPHTALGIGPAVDGGFYYDISTPSPLSSDDFPKIEEKMREIVKADMPFHRHVLSRSEALKLFREREEPFKVELIEEMPEQDEVSVYSNGDFIDLCRGPHVPSTSWIRHFKLLSLAGAYWHGDERNPVLQRVYGVAYENKSELDAHLYRLEEAVKRDHRKLAREMDLFSFHEEGPGFPFWHHNGLVMVNEILRYMREVLIQRDYQEIITPIFLNEELWHRSGHWDNYKENMYFSEIDEKSFAVKPMNCPGGVLMYKKTPHSYRDFPVKLSEMGLVHRHEKSGVLHGLFRVRAFTQDDAHIFCAPDQLEQEIIDLIDLVFEVYHTFGFREFEMELSTRPAKSIGSDEDWNRSEKALADALDKKGALYKINRGEGAFYGPKIDFHIRDSLGRMWQCGTIQVDFSMPERFELEYVGSDGEKHRPVMLHRAILGSVERFLGILIEHYGGDFPLWLAPVQLVVIPISEKHHEFAQKIYRTLLSQNLRSRLDNRNEKVGYKIREAEKQKIPFMLIVGDYEVEQNVVSVRKRHEGDLGKKSLDNFLPEIKEQIERRITH